MSLPFLTPRAVGLTRTAVQAMLAATFVASGVAVLIWGFGPLPPAWFCLGVGLLGTVVLVAVPVLAPRRSSEIAYDEGARLAWLDAQAFGYWVGLGGFVVVGNAAALGLASVAQAYFVAGMATGAAPFLQVLVAQARGRA